MTDTAIYKKILICASDFKKNPHWKEIIQPMGTETKPMLKTNS